MKHFEEEEKDYFTRVPDEYIALKLSRMRRYEVFSYGNYQGAVIFARYLNCIYLHMMGVKARETNAVEALQAALMEILNYYWPLVRAGLKTVLKDEDSFVATRE